MNLKIPEIKFYMNVVKRFLMMFRTSDHNVIVVMKTFLNKIHAKVPLITVREKLENHPEFPGMLAISDCLTDMGIENYAYKINKFDLKIEDLRFPLIAHLSERGGHFILLHSGDQNTVTYSDRDHNYTAISKTEFIQRWSGILLQGKTGINRGGKEDISDRIREILSIAQVPAALFVIVMTISIVLFKQQDSIASIFLSIAKIGGLLISLILLNNTINLSNPFLNKICGKNSDNECNSLLKSKASQITSWLSWSEIGYVYFSSTLLYLVFNPIQHPLLAWLSFLALPYTIYSISYQYLTKQWCILCTSVQILLWAECVISLGLENLHWSSLTPNDLLEFFITLLIPIIVWSFLKPLLINSNNLTVVKGQLKKFKYNKDLFLQIVTNQPKYSIDRTVLPFVLGNSNAENVLTIVSGPFCNPCEETHKYIEEWLNKDNKIRVNIIFTTTSQDENPKNMFVNHLGELNKSESKDEMHKALNEWFNTRRKDYVAWSLRYPIDGNKSSNVVTENHNAWCQMADITSTPTIFFNGYKIPSLYQLEDIKYFLDLQ